MDNGSLGLQFLGLSCMIVGVAMLCVVACEAWRMVHRKIGGLHFVRIARLRVSFCVVKSHAVQ